MGERGTWGRTLRTVAHLHPSQVARRLQLTLRRKLWERRSEAVDARYRARTPDPEARWDHPGLTAVAAHRASLRSEVSALACARDALVGDFTFLGRRESFGTDVDWFRSDLDVGTRLWKTHLHEFAYAEDLARAAATTGDDAFRARLFALARSWREAAPIGCPGFALDAWNGRATATRLIHWAIAGHRLGLASGSSEADRDADWLAREIALHALFLRDNLESDLRGNHLWRNAMGLVFAHELVGVVPDALELLALQVAEQVLPDGCHVERAPMYHALCLSDLLEVRLLLGADAPSWLTEAVARMAGWLEATVLGDGEIPLLGDGWLGEIDAPALLSAVAASGPLQRPEAPERHGGIVRLGMGGWRVVVRAGPHGPDWLLGHAHADLLSLDVSRGRERVVTDTGTLGYDPGPERRHARSTSAHNTLRLDGEEQLEAWGSFRVGRRGRARVVARGGDGAISWLWASHDAYRWLPGRPIHHRLVAVCEGGVAILDAVLGSGRHGIESRLHAHPDPTAGALHIHALGAQARGQTAPLHERHGETREMMQRLVEAETALPWCGGWIVWDASGLASDDGRGSASTRSELRFREGRIEIALPTSPCLRIDWKPEGGGAADVRVSLCSDERGSAN